MMYNDDGRWMMMMEEKQVGKNFFVNENIVFRNLFSLFDYILLRDFCKNHKYQSRQKTKKQVTIS